MKRTSEKPRILLLEDDADLQDLISSYYTPRGYDVVIYDNPSIPLMELQNHREPGTLYDLVLTDLKMPQMDGIELIRRMRKLVPDIPILLMTAHSSLEIAIEAIQEGAYDFAVKPLHFPQLTVSIERALHFRRIQSENHVLRVRVKSVSLFEGAIGRSPAMKAVFDLARRVAPSNATVLITGESGTGKEVVAKAIHQQSNRKGKAFTAINCSAIPENLLESELFGYAKGAFTGAADKKIGLFEEAEGGTLFLDEIGDLSLPLQAKLLRVIQERKIKRVGENVFRPIDVRILAATHKDLNTEVREKRFREDLFFRLNVIPIRIPPLRERPEDILPLAEHFVERFGAQNESIARGISRAGRDHLLRLPWRGNVRELENAIERAVVLSENSEIGPNDLPPLESAVQAMDRVTEASPSAPVATEALVSQSDAPATSRTESFVSALAASSGNAFNGGRDELPTLDEVTQEYVSLVLSRVGGVKERAARILKIDRKTLYRRIDAIKKTATTQVTAEH